MRRSSDGVRKTMKTDPRGLRRSGIRVRPAASSKTGCARIRPVSGDHSSGDFPVTRKMPSASIQRSSGFAMK
ncbi:MAG: hypothetical protein JXP34_21250 [Planctomycetes bacterium]|nr:hypothetical protein [Planctomycetota bacterium]